MRGETIRPELLGHRFRDRKKALAKPPPPPPSEGQQQGAKVQVAIKRTFTGKTTTRTEASTVTPPNPLEPTPRTVRFALGTKRS